MWVNPLAIWRARSNIQLVRTGRGAVWAATPFHLCALQAQVGSGCCGNFTSSSRDGSGCTYLGPSRNAIRSASPGPCAWAATRKTPLKPPKIAKNLFFEKNSRPLVKRKGVRGESRVRHSLAEGVMVYIYKYNRSLAELVRRTSRGG